MRDKSGAKGGGCFVRAASPEDAPAIAGIHVASWQRIYRGIMPDPFLDSLQAEQREPMWRRILTEGNSPVHVCCGPSGIVGFSNAGLCRESPTDAEIYAIYVHPEHWGKGCGWRLFSASCEAMRSQGFEELVLWVATENAQARGFYERAGMVPDGATKGETIGGVHVEEMRYRFKL